MIGLDSNVILRAITGDDPVQSSLARRFLSGLSDEKPGVLNAVVLAEIAWTLRTKHKYRKQEVLDRIEDLMRSNAYHVVDRNAVIQAMEICAEHAIDFADALIGEMNRSVGCETTMTFDQRASLTPAFTQLQ
jgi:predicted nucleic-acid-binding protein